MLLRLPLAAAILVVATACASRGRPAPVPAPAGDSVAPIPAPPPPAPRGGAREVIRFGPSALRYLVHQLIHVEQEFQGQTSTVDRGIRGYVSAIITGPADSAGYPLTFTVDSIVPDSGTALPPTMNLQTVRGLTLRGRLAPTGEFRDPLPSDSGLARTFAQIIGSFQNFYPRLPAGGLAVGAVWTDTVTTTDRTVVEVTTKSINNARAVDWEQRNGTRCLRLEVNSTYTLAGAGEQGGQVMELAGSGVRSTVQFLAADGRYLGGEVRDSAAIAITLPIQNTTVPVRQVSRSTISVLP